MSIDFTRVLKNFDGSEIMHGNTTQPFTLSLCAVNALVSGANDPNLSGDQQLKQYLLAEKIDGKVVDLTSEEISLIKERINKTYNAPLIAGQALKMLDPVQAKNVFIPGPGTGQMIPSRDGFTAAHMRDAENMLNRFNQPNS